MIGPLVGSVLLGLVKGYMDNNRPSPFNVETDVIGPVKEELLYRGPLYFFPRVPYGASALLFAADHLADDARADAGGPPPDAWEVLARFGDVLLGGLAYETAQRKSGILAAISCHMAHNMSVGFGSRLRGGK